MIYKREEKGGSPSNSKEQSKGQKASVQRPTAKEDREPESTHQTLATFRREWASPLPTEVCSPEGGRRFERFLCACVLVYLCVCVRAQI